MVCHLLPFAEVEQHAIQSKCINLVSNVGYPAVVFKYFLNQNLAHYYLCVLMKSSLLQVHIIFMFFFIKDFHTVCTCKQQQQ